MAIALIRKSTLGVVKEATYGTNPGMTNANAVALWGVPNFNSNYDQIEDGTIRNTLSKLGTVRGAENVSGDIGFPFKGSGTAGTAPDSDVLWECAVGAKNASTASTVVTPNTGVTTTNIILTAGGGAGFAVGDALKIGSEITWVTAKATDTLTVSPALSGIPTAGTAVGAGVHYKLATTRQSFSAQFWRGDITKEEYLGLVIESLDLDFATGQVPVPKVSFQGKSASAAVAEACPWTGIVYDSTLPLVARSMVVTIGGTTYPVSNIALSTKYDIYKQLAVTTSGTQDIFHTGRGITGSFSLLYADKTIQDAFLADTQPELRIVCGSTAGNIFAVRIPKLRYMETSKGEESGCYKYDVSFSAVPVLGEDEAQFSWL